MSELTPGGIVAELAQLRADYARGIDVLHKAREKAKLLELEADKQESLAYLNSEGTIKDREHIARIQSGEAREAAELATIEVKRIELKMKHLSEAQMGVQTSARMVELEWRVK